MDRPPQFPEHYWRSLDEHQLAAMAELSAAHEKMSRVFVLDSMGSEIRLEPLRPTGSRLFCMSSAAVPGSSDADVLVFGITSLIESLQAANWMSVAASHPDQWLDMPSERRRGGASLYKNGVNAIIFLPQHAELYQRWRTATAVCALLGGPVSREHRVEMFRLICDRAEFGQSAYRQQLGVTADYCEEQGNGFDFFLRELAESLEPPPKASVVERPLLSIPANAFAFVD